jgi:hypothetical protein
MHPFWGREQRPPSLAQSPNSCLDHTGQWDHWTPMALASLELLNSALGSRTPAKFPAISSHAHGNSLTRIPRLQLWILLVVNPPGGASSLAMAEKREPVVPASPSSIRTRPTFYSAPSQQPLLRGTPSGNESGDGISFVSGGSTFSGSSARQSSADEALTTMKVLENFDEVVARRSDPELMKKRRERRAKCKRADGLQRVNCQRLRNWADNKQRAGRILSTLGLYRAPPLPDDKDLIDLARRFYPPRWKLTVHVCDFGDGRAERCEVPLGEIENCRSCVLRV